MAGIAEYSDILVAGYKRSKSEANGLVMRFGSQFRVILQCSKEATAIVDYGDAQEISNTIVLCGDPCSRVAESSRFPMIQGVVQQFRDHVVQWLLDHAISDQRRILLNQCMEVITRNESCNLAAEHICDLFCLLPARNSVCAKV